MALTSAQLGLLAEDRGHPHRHDQHAPGLV
jgi:hypothetical protein